MGEAGTALVLQDAVHGPTVTVGQASQHLPLVEVVNPDTAVRTANQRQEGEELVDAGHRGHCLAALHTHSLLVRL